MGEDYFYRYRSVENLIGKFDELGKQQIYFADANELNDPMEGFKNVFWTGDTVLWKNLLRHYMLCLSQTVAITQVMGPAFETSTIESILQWSASSLPTDNLKQRHSRICKSFFAQKGIVECISRIAAVRPKVHRDELAYYLSSLHGIALHHVLSHFVQDGLIATAGSLPFSQELASRTTKHILDVLRAIEKSDGHEESVVPALFESGSRFLQQHGLLLTSHTPLPHQRGWRFVCLEFTEFYCKNISEVLFPSFYAACFVSDPSHAAMWGHYGNGHKGVCLKFRAIRTADGKPALRLNGIVGSRGDANGVTPIKGEQTIPFRQVVYTESFPEIDFFKSLGRLTPAALKDDWYLDDGHASAIALDDFLHDRNWMSNYWKTLHSIATTKFNDWRYEGEHRLMIHPVISKSMDKSERLLDYDFSELAGIIFGINTAMEDKLSIMKRIQDKCAETGRDQFEFLQASYSGSKKRIDAYPIHFQDLLLGRNIAAT